MLDRRAGSTYGVLFVLAVAVVGVTGAPATFAAGSPGTADTPAADATGDDRSQCPSVGLATGGSAGTAATASDHSRDSYPDPPHMDVARGDIAAIKTGVARSRTGTVRIESAGGDFDVTLTFANNDGRKPATLYLNTYLAGNETAVADLAYTAGDNDRVAVEDRDSVTGAPMPVGAYDVTIETESGTETKRLTVDDPSVGDLTLLRAPGDRFDELDDDSDVNAGLRSGVVSDPPLTSDGPQAALGDTMVYRVNASGLYGLLAAQGGQSSEENFLAITRAAGSERSGALDLDITGATACPPSVDVEGSIDADSLRVIPDSTNETLYVTADLRRVATDGSSVHSFVGHGAASYTFYRGSHITGSNTTSSVDYRVTRRESEYDPAGEVLRRDAAPGQTVAGETTLAPHTRLTLNVTAIDGDYETRARTTVNDDGTFETDLNLTEAPEDARLTLSIAEIDDSHTLLTTGNAPETAVWFREYESPSTDEATVVDNVRVALEDAGFAAAYAVPPDERVTREDLIGRSEYLQPGVHSAQVSLDQPLTGSRNVVVVAHRDADGDGQFDYPAGDSPVRIDDEPVYAAGRVVLAGDNSPPPRNPQYLTVRLPPAEEIEDTPVPTPTETPTASPSPTDEPEGTTELPPPTLRDDETATPTPGPGETTASDGTAVPTTGGNGTVGPEGTAPGETDAGDGSTDGLGPGFGPVAVVAAALLLALAGRVRRS